jgi:Zn-finger nucleic acid-binding protein
MNCPRCEVAVLTERDRDGIVVDVCLSQRGLWLDRGELEKLISRSVREFDEQYSRTDDSPPHGFRVRDAHDDQRRGYRRKRSWFESLGEIFD